MSKIFEALQFAQTERIHLDKLARTVSTEPKADTQVLRPVPVPEVHHTQVMTQAPVPEVRPESIERIACTDTQVLIQAPALEVTHTQALTQAPVLEINHTKVLTQTPVPEVRTDRAEPTVCHCDQHSHRIRRQGMYDSFLGVFGLYPWKCSLCNRQFHRSRRY